MDFREEYKQKLVSADEAVKLIKSGDWVDYGWCTNTVDALDQALAKRTDELTDVKLRGGILMKPLAVFAREDAGEHFCWNSWHMSGIERKMINRGVAYYCPIRYSELPRYYRELDCPDDVAMFQVAPMDAHGYFNFGPSASHLGAMCERAKHIIVEVNENMPRCLGGTECGIHISDVTYIVEGSNPPIGELGAGGPATDVDKAVAKLIVDEIPNGACLQLGIGGMPNAVGSLIAESDLKDLGVHTEVFTDNLIPLIKAGVVNGKRKNINKGKIVATFVQGTKELYRYVDHNNLIELKPVDYTNDVGIIAQNDKVVAICSALEVDCMGQVNADTRGTTVFSGVGGQLDFMRGAEQSKGGKPIIALPSTAKHGEVSRIVACLGAGTPVTTTRQDVHWVVTEYGAVDLFGMPIRERAKALISIAHPKFREQLEKDWAEYCRNAGMIYI